MKLLKSKKFLVAASGVIFVLINKLTELEIPESTIIEIVVLVSAYVVAQGSADKGKEAEKIRIAQENNQL